MEALEGLFLAAPEITLANIEFNNRYGIDVKKSKRDEHRLLLNVTNQSLTENIKRLSATLHLHNMNIESNEGYIMNVARNAILS